MRAGCQCHSNINSHQGYHRNGGVYRLKRIASALGINLAEINICHTNLSELIGIAQRRAHHKPYLWAHLKAIYGNVNVIPSLSKLASRGNSSHIDKIIAMVNSGASAASIEAYVDKILESQTPTSIKPEKTIEVSSKTKHFTAVA